MKLYRNIRIALINSSCEKAYQSYGDHWRDGFEDAGCKVIVFPYDQIPLVPPGYDLYFFVEIRYNPASIPWYVTPRVLYSWDSHVAGIGQYESISTCFDKILLASKIDVETAKSHGSKNFVWIPEACNPRIHKDIGLERTTPLGFIGCSNDYTFRNGKCKDDFTNHLKQGPYKLIQIIDTFGNQYTEAQNKIRIMYDRTIAHNIGTRIFESCAAGCVPLWSKAGYDTGIDQLLMENIHYIPYNDTIEDLDRVLVELFSDENRMNKVTKAAKEHVLKYHTYAHRVSDVLRSVNINFKMSDL